MSNKSDIQVGDIGLTTIGGWLGFWIKIGQTITGDASRFTHTFTMLNNNEILEGMPGGAIISPAEKYNGKAVFIPMHLDDIQKEVFDKMGRILRGTPYSFLDYLSLALLHFGIKPRRLRKYIQTSGHMICSQLSDYQLCLVGKHLFDDGRLPQDTTPGDIANWLLEQNEWRT